MTLSLILLGVGVLAYGMAGVRLSVGSRAEGGALRSSAWWWGTVLQGVGFLLTLFARQDLPLLFVQAAVVLALAVTAVAGQILGVHRMAALDAAAVAAMVVGIFVLSTATRPGPTTSVHPATLWMLLGALALCVALMPRRWPAVVAGLVAGVGYGIGAIAGRLLAARPEGRFWEFWTWSAVDWLHAILIPLGIVAGQVHLTKALATGKNLAALGAMYTGSTVFPAVAGLVLLAEEPRPGTGWLAVVALVLTAVGAYRLLQVEATIQTAEPSTVREAPA